MRPMWDLTGAQLLGGGLRVDAVPPVAGKGPGAGTVQPRLLTHPAHPSTHRMSGSAGKVVDFLNPPQV
jgi:hypothetical protein